MRFDIPADSPISPVGVTTAASPTANGTATQSKDRGEDPSPAMMEEGLPVERTSLAHDPLSSLVPRLTEGVLPDEPSPEPVVEGDNKTCHQGKVYAKRTKNMEE